MKEIKITLDRTLLDEVEAVLLEYSENGWDVSDDVTAKDLTDPALAWGALIDPELVGREKDCLTILAYAEDEKALVDALAEYDVTCEVRTLPEIDYQAEWKKTWKGIVAGGFHIQPSWEEPEEGAIRIDPGMAFGTGTHETTKLALTLLAETKPRRFYDVGTGSGILAIAAARLGATEILATDIDPLAVKQTEENFALNGVTGTVRTNDLLKGVTRTADTIAANLLAELVVRFLPVAKSLLQDDGVLIVSGILAEKEETVREAAAKSHFVVTDTAREGDWIALRLEHDHAFSR